MPMTRYQPTLSGGRNRKMTTFAKVCTFLFICMLGLCFIQTVSSSAQALIIDGDHQYGFAEELFKTHQYRRAAEEYQRFAFFFPFDSRKQPALFKAGQAFLLAKDPVTAIEIFKSFTEEKKQDKLGEDAYFMLAECHLVMNSPGLAVVEMRNLIAENDDPNVRDRAFYRMGWLYIDQGNWTAAETAFSHISSARRDHYQLDTLDDELNLAHRLPTRSPAVAGTLSILPGAGQLYCNRYEDALIAFLVNLGLLWAAHDAFDQEQYALGGLLTFVGTGFYVGNIYSATSDAHKFNRKVKADFAHSLKKNIVLGLAPTPDAEHSNEYSCFLGLQIPF